jgi:hypothetical protein
LQHGSLNYMLQSVELDVRDQSLNIKVIISCSMINIYSRLDELDEYVLNQSDKDKTTSYSDISISKLV